MPRTLLKNGYVVTVDGGRAVHPGDFVAIDGARISAVGPLNSTPNASGFDDVIDLSGCIVLPGLINGHQHHWYTLFKGLADGYLLEDWVTDFLLPLTRHFYWTLLPIGVILPIESIGFQIFYQFGQA